MTARVVQAEEEQEGMGRPAPHRWHVYGRLWRLTCGQAVWQLLVPALALGYLLALARLRWTRTPTSLACRGGEGQGRGRGLGRRMKRRQGRRPHHRRTHSRLVSWAP